MFGDRDLMKKIDVDSVQFDSFHWEYHGVITYAACSCWMDGHMLGPMTGNSYWEWAGTNQQAEIDQNLCHFAYTKITTYFVPFYVCKNEPFDLYQVIF